MMAIPSVEIGSAQTVTVLFSKNGIIALAVSPLLVGAAPPPVVDPGPAPSFASGVALGEAAIKASLIDPDSAQFDWPYAFTGGTLKALFGRTRAGWYTCGFVNARNRMGGYTGRAWFLLMIKDGAVASLDVGQPDQIDTASVSCPAAVKSGNLVPETAAGAAPSAVPSPSQESYMAIAQHGATDAAAHGGLGISFIPAPMGAVITIVAPASDAERAALKPGETIESVNGVSIKGFSAGAMTQALHADTPTIRLGVVGIGNVDIARVHRAP
jgi:hypothetical protein